MKPGEPRRGLSLPLSRSADQQLTALAHAQGVSKAVLARTILEEHLKPISPGRSWELDSTNDDGERGVVTVTEARPDDTEPESALRDRPTE